MIERFLAHKLLRIWASSRSREVRHVDYPRISPMFRDYQSGYRASVQTIEEEMIPEKVGMILQEMHPALSRTLKQFYFEGRDLRRQRKAFNLAMSEFCRRYDSTPLDLGNGAALQAAI